MTNRKRRQNKDRIAVKPKCAGDYVGRPDKINLKLTFLVCLIEMRKKVVGLADLIE